jgi:hypothetical protein
MSTDTVADIYQKPGAPYSTSTDAYSSTTIGAAAATVEAASVVCPTIANALPPVLLPGVNILTKTQLFENAVWTKTRASVTANAIAAPDLTLTADKLVEDATANNTHTLNGTAATTVAEANYIWSIYAKAGERTRIRLRAATNITFLGDMIVDLLTGTVVWAGRANLVPAVAGIIDAGNGWYRLWMRIPTQPLSVSSSLNVWLVDTGLNTTYDGNGTSGVYLWGAQLEQSDTLHAYTAVA